MTNAAVALTVRFLLLLCALPTGAPFALPMTSLGAVRDVGVGGGHVLYSEDEPASQIDGAGEDDVAPKPYVSDLKALLPTPKKRTLKLDKFGRRIHDLTDDGTTRYSKGPSGLSATAVAAAIASSAPNPAYDPEPMRSDADATRGQISMANDEAGDDVGGGGEAPSTASEGPAKSPKELAADASSADFSQAVQSSADLKALTNEDASKSAKELAADASSADFGKPVSVSADLKAFLPTQKMRFEKLDKFGRRVHIVEAAGTPTRKSEAPKSYSRGTRDGFSSDSESAVGAPFGPKLSDILGKGQANVSDDAKLGEGAVSVDLKELLPKQKMRFMKLDKFGRRVQMMEDDGTVYLQKEPSAASDAPSDEEITSAAIDEEASVDLDNTKSSGAAYYGSLKDLLPTRRAVWTKLDFKGAPVEDNRRFKTKAKSGSVGGEFKQVGSGNTAISGEVGTGGSLRDLLPKRATWTKLDFRGASVVDERRMKNIAKSGGSDDFNKGQYSNLRTLLPARTITWKKDQALSSGSATTVSENPRGLREERQQAMKDEAIASASTRSDADSEVAEDLEE